MLESLTEFWYLWAVAVVLLFVLIFVVIKVSKTVAKRNEENEKLRKDFERIKMLKEKYLHITKESVENSDAKELAEAGATRTTSAFFAMEICATWNWKLRSNVSTIHLLPVSVSKVTGVMN